MALIKCIECGNEISDMAKTCIHCGCPIETKNNSTNINVDYDKIEEIEIAKIGRNFKNLIVSIIFFALATYFTIESGGDMYWLPLFLYVIGFITLILFIFLPKKTSENNTKTNKVITQNEENKNKYLSLIRDDEKIVMIGNFNKQLQKKIISTYCFPLFAITIFFTIMGVIWFFDDNEPICIIISVIAILLFIGTKKLKNWLFSFVDDEYLVLTDKRLLLKLKWQKISLVYSKITTVSTFNFIYKTIRLVVNLGSSIYICHLINDDEIAEEILKRLD